MRKKYSSLTEMILDRNKKLENFFTKRGLAVQLIGDINQPIVIVQLENTYFAVSAHVKNFKYNFTTTPFNGEIVKTIDLNISLDEFSASDLWKLLKDNEQRSVYLIVNSEAEQMCFHSIETKNDIEHVYWCDTDPHYFLSKEKVEDLSSILESYNYSITIVQYDFPNV